jgi:chlorite dismutase
VRATAISGLPLAPAARLLVDEGAAGPPPNHPAWSLEGITSNQRYTSRAEKDALLAIQAPLGRPQATCAALIPIAKSAAWWDLAQDERRAIFEDQSRHIAASMKYLPAIARRLHHCRELGGPFDFLTWFEYAPQEAQLFDELVAMLRGTAEWAYVDREVDLRLVREGD